MKTSILYFILLISQANLFSQGVFMSLGSGISNISSDFENRYSNSYNFNFKIGYDKYFNNLGIRASFGYFDLNTEIVEIGNIVNIGFIKISSGLIYDISSSTSLLAQIYLGKTTRKSLRISSPRYNYDFDPFDYSYSFELNKKIKIVKCNCFSLGLEFSKSFNGIIDNNFWQKDNLKPYFLNVNVYYFFERK